MINWMLLATKPETYQNNQSITHKVIKTNDAVVGLKGSGTTSEIEDSGGLVTIEDEELDVTGYKNRDLPTIE